MRKIVKCLLRIHKVQTITSQVEPVHAFSYTDKQIMCLLNTAVIQREYIPLPWNQHKATRNTHTFTGMYNIIYKHKYVTDLGKTKNVHFQYFWKVSIMKRMLPNFCKKYPMPAVLHKRKIHKTQEKQQINRFHAGQVKKMKMLCFSWGDTAWHQQLTVSWFQLALQSQMPKFSAHGATKLSALEHIKLVTQQILPLDWEASQYCGWFQELVVYFSIQKSCFPQIRHGSHQIKK